jgi:hypothetical protein
VTGKKCTYHREVCVCVCACVCMFSVRVCACLVCVCEAHSLNFINTVCCVHLA